MPFCHAGVLVETWSWRCAEVNQFSFVKNIKKRSRQRKCPLLFAPTMKTFFQCTNNNGATESFNSERNSYQNRCSLRNIFIQWVGWICSRASCRKYVRLWILMCLANPKTFIFKWSTEKFNFFIGWSHNYGTCEYWQANRQKKQKQIKISPDNETNQSKQTK